MVYREHVIRHGDTLWAIARNAGISLARLYELNPEFKTNPKYRGGNMIWAGGRVVLEPGPRSGTSSSAHAPAPGTGGYQKPYEWPTPVTGPAREKSYEDQIAALTGPNRDAYKALTILFNSYDLGTLAPTILKYIQNGFSAETITTELQQTQEYRTRFAGNEKRQAAGLPVLDPRQYLDIEASYRQIMRNAGLPPQFYDQHADFVDWIGADVAPTEVKSRVDMAVQSTTNAPPEFVNALGQLGVDTGHIVAWFLDQNRAEPLLHQTVQAAQIGSSALRQGLTMDANRARAFANMGITQEQANSAYQHISYMLPSLEQLGHIYGRPYTQATAENELLFGSGAAQMERQKLTTQETGTFSGSTAVNEKSLGIPTLGKF